MSSGLPLVPGMAASIVRKLSPMAMARVKNLGMTPRQQRLNWLWSWYCTTRYDSRKIDFDGTERIEDPLDIEAIGTAGVLPPGFYDAGVDFPVKFRRPSAPYPLPRVIVNRFTGLLFSESQHPKIRSIGSPKTEDYATALAEYSRLWAAMVLARTFGGATGTFVIGFKFITGRPAIEVLDPRWVTPKFKSRDTLELASIEHRWAWPEYVLMEDGNYEEVWYWTRRLVDEQMDVVWNRVPVGNGDEPAWLEIPPDDVRKHGFGFCPFHWGQNQPVTDSEDGEPDCIGAYDMVEEADQLIAAGGLSLKRNLDPTVIISTDLKLAELRKGSDNAIKVEKGGDAKYMEGTFEGPKQALAHAEKLRDWILEVTQCVLDSEDAQSPETATKVRERQANMRARADIFREQYGQACVLPLLDKMIRAIRQLGISQPGAAPDGGPLRKAVVLPPREVTNPDGTKQYVPRELPPEGEESGLLALEWPPYSRPTSAEAQAASGAVKSAMDAGGMSVESAVRYLQPYFGYEDAVAEVARIKAEAAERRKNEEAAAKASWAGRGGGF